MEPRKIHTPTASAESDFGSRAAMTGVWLICIAAAYKILQQFDLFTFAQTTENVAGLGTAVLIGLAASASSCLAMVGGLLLSVSAAWAEAHPNVSHWRRLEPLLSFNVGRVAGYFVLGGLTGLIGHSILLSVKTTGIVKVLLSLIMILLGLKILNLIPKRFCSIKLPAGFLRHIRTLSESDHWFAPAVLGAFTYFVPCGFTQSMQLLALGTGSFWQGGLLMLAFAVGTLPALLGISLASSLSEGRAARVIFTFAGTLSIFLGIVNMNSGFALAGINLESLIPCCSASTGADPNVTIDRNGRQVLSVVVHSGGYDTNSFTVEKGKETWIYADAPEGLSGCISQMALPDFGILQPINKGPNWVGPFTPTKDFQFMCSMGMFRASVHVRS